MKQSLVEKARAVKVRNRNSITKQDVELALAWAKREVSLTAVHKTWGGKSLSNTYLRLAITLRAYYLGEAV